MDIGNILNTGVQGFQKATAQANEAAQNIASTSIKDASQESIDNADLTSNLVDLKVAEHSAKANVKVIETASDLVGTLLDVKV